MDKEKIRLQTFSCNTAIIYNSGTYRVIWKKMSS
jgi:hypothetical protein